MAINRFSQPIQQSKYQPLSFQELAFAPVQMRQREDAMLNSTDEMQALWANYKGADQYNEETQIHIEALQDKAKGLVKKLQESGSGDPSAMSELRNIRNEYNTLISENGVLGKSAKVRESFDNAKTAFYAAAQKEGWSKADTDRNWELAASGYASKLPKSLKGHTGSIPNFETPFVPAKEDMSDFYMKHHKILGMIQEEHPGAKVSIVPDENGIPRRQIVNGNGDIISNSTSLNALKALAKETIYDPSSSLSQSMTFAGKNPEDLLEDAELLSNMIYSLRKTNTSSGNSAASKTSNKSKTPKSKAGLRKTTSASSTLVDTPENAAKRLREIEMMPQAAQTDEIKSEKLALQQGIQTYMAAEKTEEFDNTMKQAFESGQLDNKLFENMGIHTWEDFQNKRDEYIEILDEQEKVKAGSLWSSIVNADIGFGKSIAGKIGEAFGSEEQLKYEAMMETMKPHYQKAVNATGYRTNSESFIFSHGEAGQKIQQTLSKQFADRGLESLLANNAISVTPDRVSTAYESVGGLNGDNEEFKNMLAKYKANEATMEFESITTGGLGQAPSIEYKMVDDDGNVQYLSFNLLRDKEFANDILDPDEDFVQSLDAEAKATIGAVRDKVLYAGLDTTILTPTRLESQYPNKRFTKDQTENVNKYAHIATKNLFGFNPVGTKKPVGVDKLLVDTAFFKPGGEDGIDYSVDLNEDGSYSGAKRHKDGRVEHLTLGDHFERLYAKNFYERMKTYTDDLYNSADEQKARQLYAADYIENIILGNTLDLENPQESLLVYNDSNEFNTALQSIYELNHKVKTASTNTDRESYKLELFDVIDSIKHLKLQSKRAEPILQ
jgi:hypothetical protein